MMETAVVTGAGSGIGRAAARRLAQAGYRIAVLGRRIDALDETLGQLDGEGHLRCPGDLTAPSVVADVAEQILEEFEQVAALVHCAGGGLSRHGDELADLSTNMAKVFETNVISVAMLTEALTPILTDERGRVVAISSIAALRGGGTAYGTAKAALHGWAYDTAASLGTRRITVNIVAPGYIADTEFFGESMTPERHDRLVSETMVGRPGKPDDVASTIEYLVSSEARHVTGQVVQVNGGALPR